MRKVLALAKAITTPSRPRGFRAMAEKYQAALNAGDYVPLTQTGITKKIGGNRDSVKAFIADIEAARGADK